MKTPPLMFLAVLFAVAGCAHAQGPTSQPAVDNTLPRYGDPGRETIWSRASPEERNRLPELSKDAAKRGWDYVGRGDLDTAMRRFNQAWLLYPQNADALWGMAIVQYQRAQQAAPDQPNEAAVKLVDESLGLFADAKAAGAASASFLTDQALVTASRGGLRKAMEQPAATADFDEAEALLRKAEKLEANPHVYETWAALEQYRGNSAKAADYERRAKKLRDQAGGR